jgi:hypothetical protein
MNMNGRIITGVTALLSPDLLRDRAPVWPEKGDRMVLNF